MEGEESGGSDVLKGQLDELLKRSDQNFLVDRLEKLILFLKGNRDRFSSLPDYVVEVIAACINGAQGVVLWIQVLNLHSTKPARAIYYANLAMGMYRYWSSMALDDSYTTEVPLYREDYLIRLTSLLCDAFVEGDDQLRTQWGRLVSSLSSETKRYIFKYFCQNSSSMFGELSVSYLSSEMSLEFLSAILSKLSQDGGSLQPTLMKNLISSNLNAFGMRPVFHAIVKHISSKSVAEDLVDYMDSEHSMLVVFVRFAARLWGSSASIQKGKSELHKYLTDLLIASMPRISQEDLLDDPSTGQYKEFDDTSSSALSYLSCGVSACLDAADKDYRIRGMRVAKSFSEIMGVPLHVDENNFDDNVSSDSVIDSKSKGVGAAGLLEHESSSDSECSLEGYLLDSEDEASFADATKNDNLQLPESADDARDKQLAALHCIPLIVKSRPADARDICAPLIKELLRFSNRYNIEKLDDLRAEAILSLYITYPHFSASVLTWAVGSDSLALPTRLECVTILVKGAYSLSGIKEPGRSESHGPDVALSPSQTTVLKASSEFPEGRSKSSEKTIIKRPRRLAAISREKLYIRNNFAPVIETVFFPVATVIADLLHSSAKDASSSRNGDIIILQENAANIGAVKNLFSHCSVLSETSRTPIEARNGIDVMLPSQCLLALAAFVRCSVNTTSQRKVTLATAQLAFSLREVEGLQLRRAAAVGMHASVESWFHLRKNAETAAHARRESLLEGNSAITPLSYIMSLGSHFLDESVASGGLDEDPGNAMILQLLQWATQIVHNEADVACRSVYLDMLRIAVAGMS